MEETDDAGTEDEFAVMVDDHQGKARHQPLRRCIVSGKSAPREEMIRFVISPEGELVADLAANLPGRGLWVTARREDISRAVAKGVFAKAARRQLRIRAELVTEIEALLRQRCLEMLGLARRAGQAVAGFAKVDEALRKGRVALLLAAEDGAEDGRRRLEAKASGVKTLSLFSSSELAAALGREGAVVHVAIMPGGLAEGLWREAQRYAGVREV